jgi:hypothetical protein
MKITAMLTNKKYKNMKKRNSIHKNWAKYKDNMKIK